MRINQLSERVSSDKHYLPLASQPGTNCAPTRGSTIIRQPSQRASNVKDRCREYIANASTQPDRSTQVPIGAFGSAFPEVVRSLSGKPEKLLNEVGLDPDMISQTVDYRTMAKLFEKTSCELSCPDLGLRLAHQSENWLSVLGPLEFAMRSAPTLREAMQCCGRYLHLYSGAVHTSLEIEAHTGRDYLLWDLLVSDIAYPRQVTEHAICLTHNVIKELTNGLVRPAEIWFTHSNLAPVSYYRKYFDVPVRFGKPYNAVYFARAELDTELMNGDSDRFTVSLDKLVQQHPAPLSGLTRRIRVILAGLLAMGRCSQSMVAEKLKMHPRTLQRRLCEEGTTFEHILNIVRREIALRNLSDQRVPLAELVDKLGYSEASVLTRSCYRWFNQSPRQVRKEALYPHSPFC